MQKYPIIIGILEFRERGFSYTTVQKRWNVGASTVRRTVCRFEELGMSLNELKALSPEKVQALFYPEEAIRRKEVPLPDYQKCYDRLHKKGSKVNLTFLWYEYKEQHPDGYQLTQFCEYYNRFVEEHYGTQKVVRDHRFQPKNDHRFQPVQMSSNSTNIQNAVDSIFVSLSYLRQYGSVAEVHLSDYLVLSSVRLACKVEAIGSVEKTVQYALRKN